MKCTLLGSGTSIPSASRGSPGAFLDGEGRGVLLDPGSGTGGRLARAGIGLAEIGTILITHFHVDHVGDLGPILFALRNPRYAIDGRWPRLAGPPGLAEVYRLLRAAHQEWLPEPEREFELIEWSGERARWGGLTVEAFPVAHRPESLAYRFVDASGAVLTWSGDTEYCSGIVQAARAADLLFLECSSPRGQDLEGHLDPAGVSRIARESAARQIVLMHFYPECDEVDLIAQMDADVSARIRLGKDLEEYAASPVQ